MCHTRLQPCNSTSLDRNPRLHMFCATADPYQQSHLLLRHTRIRPSEVLHPFYCVHYTRSRPLQHSSQAYGGSAHTIFRFLPLFEAHNFFLDFGPLSALLDFGLCRPVGFRLSAPWISACCWPSWISARCRPLLDFGPLSALLDFGPLSALLDFGPLSASFGFRPVVGPLGFRPVVGPLGFRPVVGLFWISAHCWPFLDFGPLSASFGVWPIVGPFESAFSSYLQPLLATRQPLSSLAVSTIYGPFPASATTVIIISDFKLKVAEYSTLSLRGDVRI
jgi:hypothetical protein